MHYEHYDEGTGVVTISLSGACVDCSSATVTMRFMIRNVMMLYIPEVTDVVRKGYEDDDS